MKKTEARKNIHLRGIDYYEKLLTTYQNLLTLHSQLLIYQPSQRPQQNNSKRTLLNASQVQLKKLNPGKIRRIIARDNKRLKEEN